MKGVGVERRWSGVERWAVQCGFWLLLLVASSGCQRTGDTAPGNVELKGKITLAGKPLEVAGREVGLGMVRVEFYAIQDGQVQLEPRVALADAEGNFSVTEGGVSPGRYRVCIYQWDPYPQTDKLKGKYAAGKSNLEVEITGEPLTIDLSLPDAGLKASTTKLPSASTSTSE